MADGEKRTVTAQTPPKPGGGGGAKRDDDAGGGAPKAARRPGRPTQFDKLRGDLEDVFASLALVQGSMVFVTGDERHDLASQVTLEYAPQLAEAWTDLARQDTRVFNMLKRLTTGSAWGAVIMTTGGFLVAQAGAYGLMPEWSPFAAPAGVPAGDPTDPRDNGAPVPPVPPVPSTAKDPRNSAPDGGVSRDPAQNPAEQQRRAVEQRRQQRGS